MRRKGQRQRRPRRRKAGLVRKEVWVHPNDWEEVQERVKVLGDFWLRVADAKKTSDETKEGK